MANTWGIKRSDRGYAKIGTLTPAIIPVQRGVGLQFPPKYQMSRGVANNIYDIAYFKGLYYPMFRGPVDVISDWFTAANLNTWFVTRGLTVGVGLDDLSEMPAFVYSDGNRVYTFTKPKGAMFSLGARQNEQLRCTLGIGGADQSSAALTLLNSPTAPATVRGSWADVTFVSGVHGVIDFTLTIDNALVPNPIMGEGSGNAVVELNAGNMEVRLDLTVDATGTFPVNEGAIVFTVQPPGAVGPVTFTLPRVRIDNPDEVGHRDLRAYQPFTVVGLTTDGLALPLQLS